MNTLAKGWCPGALRPMESGDGLIVRLRLSCNEASPALMREIAGWSEAYGNGALDLSARGNLQLRGVRAATLPLFTEKLREAGLLDASPQAESVRNVLVSPFAGSDVREDARALEREISVNQALWELPNKFGFSFDEGDYPLGDDSDVRFVTAAGGYAVYIGEFVSEPLPREAVVDVARQLAQAFLTVRELDPALRRMRDAASAVIRHGERSDAIHGAVDASAPERQSRHAGWLRFVSHDGERRSVRPAADWLGPHSIEPSASRPLPPRGGGQGWGAPPNPATFVGVALPFGRITAPNLAALADLAEQAGATTLRLTPWRAIVIPGAGSHFAHAAARLDLILDPADPRLHVAACPGAPACSSALGETRAVATRLAPFASGLHVSGCRKGCAHPAPALWTVVAANGGYDLIRAGRVDSGPFARGLSLDALATILQEHAAP